MPATCRQGLQRPSRGLCRRSWRGVGCPGGRKIYLLAYLGRVCVRCCASHPKTIPIEMIVIRSFDSMCECVFARPSRAPFRRGSDARYQPLNRLAAAHPRPACISPRRFVRQKLPRSRIALAHAVDAPPLCPLLLGYSFLCGSSRKDMSRSSECAPSLGAARQHAHTPHTPQTTQNEYSTPDHAQVITAPQSSPGASENAFLRFPHPLLLLPHHGLPEFTPPSAHGGASYA